MDFISEKRAEKRAKVLILLICLLPQLLRVVLNCIYSYEIEGNLAYSVIIADICYYSADIFGKISFFSIFGCSVFLTFRYGLRRGGEWVILYIGLYIAAYILLGTVSSSYFGAVAFGVSAILSTVAAVVSFKRGRGVFALSVLTLTVPIFGGVVQLYFSTVPSVEEIIYILFYATANFGFEMLLLLLTCRLAFLLRERNRGESSVSGKLISLRNPCMLTVLILDIAYVLISLVDPTVSIVNNLIEYGPPVNADEWMSIISVYAEYLVVFVIGYAAMRFALGLMEGIYAAEEKI